MMTLLMIVLVTLLSGVCGDTINAGARQPINGCATASLGSDAGVMMLPVIVSVEALVLCLYPFILRI